MKTASKRSGYPKKWWNKGGFPDEYPYRTKFIEHIKKMDTILSNLENSDTYFPDGNFMHEINNYRYEGFTYFADLYMIKYHKIKETKANKLWKNKRMDLMDSG